MVKTKRIAVRRKYLMLLRQRYKVSGSDVAAALGITLSTYYRCERGEYDYDEKSRTEYLSKLAKLFNLPADELMNCEKEYIQRKVNHLMKAKSGKKSIYTLHAETIQEYKRQHPHPTMRACAAETGFSRNTVAKYWNLDKDEEGKK